jgi:hypothetical protein
MNNTYELHFCEGCYFMAVEKGKESSIIDNTFTEYIGDIKTTQKSIKKILDNLGKLKVELK